MSLECRTAQLRSRWRQSRTIPLSGSTIGDSILAGTAINALGPGSAIAMHQPDGDETVLVLHGRAFVEMDEDRRTSLTHRFLDTGAEKLLPMYRIDEKADVSRMLIATGETGPAYAETARSGP